MAEEARDDVAAEEVVGRQPVPLHDRRRARLRRGVVLGVVLRVLRVRVVHGGDRRDAHPVKVASRMRRVALEIPMKRPIVASDDKRITRPREVIHSDVLVSGRSQPADGIEEEL